MQDTARLAVNRLAKEVLATGNPSDPAIGAVRCEFAYADPTAETVPADAETLRVGPWPGLPKASEADALRAADGLGSEDIGDAVITDVDGRVYDLPVRHRQDEFLEWMVTDDCRRITFVSEPYDYFSTLFDMDETEVVALYQDFTRNSSITADDLRAPRGLYFQEGNRRHQVARAGGFNPRNQFNVMDGIVHTSHRANSMAATGLLVGASSLARLDARGDIVSADDARRVVCCCGFGNPNRHSDQLISELAYQQVLSGYRFTLSNPAGVYIAGVAEGLMMPDTAEPVPAAWWRVIRGTGQLGEADARILRLELEIPDNERWAGRQLTLSDLLIEGRPVRFASQIAQLVQMQLFLTRWKRPEPGVGPVVPCRSTCCKVEGSDQMLPPQNGACPPGTVLAYPDLLANGSETASNMAEFSCTTTDAKNWR